MIACIISDIHANWEALSAVLREIDSLPMDSLYCLGDLVGYNADPDICVSKVVSRARLIVRGNHDKAAAGILSMEWFNSIARKAVEWTKKTAGPETLRAVASLPMGPREAGEGVLLCHGSPMDEDRYIMDEASMRESFEFLGREFPGVRVCLHGHTHVPLAAGMRKNSRKVEVLPLDEELELDGDSIYLINPGSVGQPRDGNSWASFGILDSGRRVYKTMRVAYDVAGTRKKIIAAGLPGELARRLEEGW
jgi:diadenosine tetraphosphatase ApaH/serine/threonine PP2A family protein phosphatase